MPAENLQKILLVQPYSNGDCLYATAVARQIKHDFPYCHLTWAIAPFCRGVLNGNPHVDEVLVLEGLTKDDLPLYRSLKKSFLEEKEAGKWNQVFFTAVIDSNQALYNGSIRDAILAAYPHPITEGIQPVLRPLPAEEKRVTQWVQDKKLATYKHIILFEFAPQSGQSTLTKETAVALAEEICRRGDTAVILSSPHKVETLQKGVIDGSELTYRESVFLSKYCTLLLGTSSGITWGTTSDGGKLLPMVQLLNPWTPWVNPISRDFERHGLPAEIVIERFDADPKTILACVQEVLNEGITVAKKKWNQPLPLHFKTTERIVYNLLCYGQFSAIKKHVSVNQQAFGKQPAFFKAIAKGVLGAPLKLLRNVYRKKLKPGRL